MQSDSRRGKRRREWFIGSLFCTAVVLPVSGNKFEGEVRGVDIKDYKFQRGYLCLVFVFFFKLFCISDHFSDLFWCELSL